MKNKLLEKLKDSLNKNIRGLDIIVYDPSILEIRLDSFYNINEIYKMADVNENNIKARERINSLLTKSISYPLGLLNDINFNTQFDKHDKHTILYLDQSFSSCFMYLCDSLNQISKKIEKKEMNNRPFKVLTLRADNYRSKQEELLTFLKKINSEDYLIKFNGGKQK